MLIYASLVDLLAEDFLSEEANLLMNGKKKAVAFAYVLAGGEKTTTSQDSNSRLITLYSHRHVHCWSVCLNPAAKKPAAMSRRLEEADQR